MNEETFYKQLYRLHHFCFCEMWGRYDTCYASEDRMLQDFTAFSILSSTGMTITEFLKMKWGQLDLDRLCLYKSLDNKTKKNSYPIHYITAHDLFICMEWDLHPINGDDHKEILKVWRWGEKALYRRIRQLAEMAFIPNPEMWTPGLLKKAYRLEVRETLEDPEFHEQLLKTNQEHKQVFIDKSPMKARIQERFEDDLDFIAMLERKHG